MQREFIAILDFGSQYTQLIARRFRELGVYSEILPPATRARALRARGPSGIVLSGGPDSVYAPRAPRVDPSALGVSHPSARVEPATPASRRAKVAASAGTTPGRPRTASSQACPSAATSAAVEKTPAWPVPPPAAHALSSLTAPWFTSWRCAQRSVGAKARPRASCWQASERDLTGLRPARPAQPSRGTRRSAC